MTGIKHWLVNFETMDFLHHGIRNKLWMMGYQYTWKGNDEPGRKAAITRNWRRLLEFSPGDKFVAYVPGNKYFATGTVINPRGNRRKPSHCIIPCVLRSISLDRMQRLCARFTRNPPIDRPIPNDKLSETRKTSAFTMGQRYVAIERLKQAKTASDLD